MYLKYIRKSEFYFKFLLLLFDQYLWSVKYPNASINYLFKEMTVFDKARLFWWRFFHKQTYLLSEPLDVEYCNISSIEKNSSTWWIIESLYELCCCRFTTSTRTNQSHGLTFLYWQWYIIHNLGWGLNKNITDQLITHIIHTFMQNVTHRGKMLQKHSLLTF